MSLFDVVTVALVLGYAVFGFFTGVVRRAVGLVSVFVAALAATHAAPLASGILRQQWGSLSVSDSRAYAWFAVFALIMAVAEFSASLVHRELQFSVVALNRPTGAGLGLITSIALISAFTYMLLGLAEVTGPNFGSLERSVHSSLSASVVGLPLASLVSGVALPPFYGTLPRNPVQYFAGTSA